MCLPGKAALHGFVVSMLMGVVIDLEGRRFQSFGDLGGC